MCSLARSGTIDVILLAGTEPIIPKRSSSYNLFGLAPLEGETQVVSHDNEEEEKSSVPTNGLWIKSGELAERFANVSKRIGSNETEKEKNFQDNFLLSLLLIAGR